VQNEKDKVLRSLPLPPPCSLFCHILDATSLPTKTPRDVHTASSTTTSVHFSSPSLKPASRSARPTRKTTLPSLPIVAARFNPQQAPNPATPPGTTLKGTGSTTTTPRPSTDTQVLVLDQSAQNLIKIDYVIISRRSREQAGLRYQRRGVDDDANATNFTEAETIMRVVMSVRLAIKAIWGIKCLIEGEEENIFSHVQIQGSSSLRQSGRRMVC